MPRFIAGMYLQHDFSESFGLQLNINYQNCSNHWQFGYWDRYEEGTDSIGSYSFSLNGIATASRSAMTEFYFLGGIGIFTGPFDYRKSFLQFSAGTGVKLRVRPGSRTFVNLAAVWHHFFYHYGGASNGDYLRLQAGLELPLYEISRITFNFQEAPGSGLSFKGEAQEVLCAPWLLSSG